MFCCCCNFCFCFLFEHFLSLPNHLSMTQIILHFSFSVKCCDHELKKFFIFFFFFYLFWQWLLRNLTEMENRKQTFCCSCLFVIKNFVTELKNKQSVGQWLNNWLTHGFSAQLCFIVEIYKSSLKVKHGGCHLDKNKLTLSW